MSTTQRTTTAQDAPSELLGGGADELGLAPSGRRLWRSLDDLSRTAEFREFVHREFPAFASELLAGSRRSFLKVMGASFALAGVAGLPGCRRPDHRIVPHNTAPETSIPGKALYYATALPAAGGWGVEGVMVETHNGRPTKLEGNPAHPVNAGKTSLRAQAEILSLYDPDRDPLAARERSGGSLEAAEWAAFERDAPSVFGSFDATQGAGLAFLVEKASSPSRDRLRDAITARWPRAAWLPYEAVDSDSALEGAEIAFGRPLRVDVKLEHAEVVVSFGRDLLGTEGGPDAARGFAQMRYRPGSGDRSAADARMSRWYVAESAMTATGAQADHRVRLTPRRVDALAIAVAARILADNTQTGGAMPFADIAGRLLVMAREIAGEDLDQGFIDAVARDVVGATGEHLGKSLLVAGESQSPLVHAALLAVNMALGNVGRTVLLREPASDEAAVSSRSIARLAEALGEGSIETLVCIGGNPAYNAPASLGLGDALADRSRLPRLVYLGEGNETAAAASHWLPRAHPLETWGDVVAPDGTYSVTQPMIRPLFGGRSELELLSMILGPGPADGYDIVRRTFGERVRLSTLLPGGRAANPAFDRQWRSALGDGVSPAASENRAARSPRLRVREIARAFDGSEAGFRRGDESEIELLFLPCAKVWDGRYANNGWLQEMPDPVTKITWDNPALMSMATAERLGLRTSSKLGGPLYNKVDSCDVTVDGVTVRVPVWIQPGMADGVVALTLGYGRSSVGRVGEGVGFDVNPLRRTGSRAAVADGVARARGQSPHLIATVQDHWAIDTVHGKWEDGREIYRDVSLYWWRRKGDAVIKDKDAYGVPRTARGAKRLGVESHTPVNRDVYNPSGRGGSIHYFKADDSGDPVLDAEGRKQRPENQHGAPLQQWGMSIDLTSCIGCGVCTVACQAENNIPIVGKAEVAKGREMHWIRVDRYYAGEVGSGDLHTDPDVLIQPVTCMHCENAPCEVVCPVNATVHGREGTNNMAYNRCIGTRYCSNNCPYKVRRFNYFDYATKRFQGSVNLGLLDENEVDNPGVPLATSNDNFVPPRLREPVTEVEQLKHNPDVTVRNRGVMEKCTFCIQRINASRVETKLADMETIPDGFFETACQQACPTGAIVFGDIYDYESNGGRGAAVVDAKNDPRTYAMLDYLNILPRTTYQLRVRNFNEALRPHGPDPFEHGHSEGHPAGDHGAAHSEAGRISLPILDQPAAGVGVQA